jgi:RPA family protein
MDCRYPLSLRAEKAICAPSSSRTQWKMRAAEEAKVRIKTPLGSGARARHIHEVEATGCYQNNNTLYLTLPFARHPTALPAIE